jgi:V/A-type H+-transporting ATPase subunit I
VAVAEIQKMQIFILQKKLQEFLAGLQSLSCFEISNVAEYFAPGQNGAALSLRYQKIIDFLDALFPRPRGFIENFIQVKPVVKKSAAEAFLQKQPRETLSRLEKLQSSWELNKRRIKQRSGELARQELYAVFGLPRARQAAKLRRVSVIFGTTKTVDPEIMQVIAPGTAKTPAFVQLFCLREDEANLRDRLSGAGFQEIILPLQKLDYVRESGRLRNALKKARAQAAALKNKLAALHAAEYRKLAVWADYLTNAGELEACALRLSATEKTGLITGWVPVAQKKQLINYLEKFAEYLYWREVEPAQGETPPVALRNKIAAPLESVTALYGLPNPQEFDPSPLMAPFFILFYGLALSDAGYGLLLTLAAAALLWKFRANLTAFGRKLLALNVYCGVSTIIVGLLTGSVFGIDFNILPWPVVKKFFLSVKIIDPLSNPLPLLGLSVGLGAVQILTGLFLRFLLDVRQKGWGEAFLQSGCWTLFLAAIFSYAGASFARLDAAAKIAGYAVLGGVVFMILTQGRQQKNPLLKLCSGLLSLYNLSGYVGDLLSYTRLFALGLVTAVLAMVINYLAAMTGGVPFIGVILMTLIFIFGHILDFLINLLGAFVHSARLQYVEYFSKFFEGGGRIFKPFAWRTKYVSLEK